MSCSPKHQARVRLTLEIRDDYPCWRCEKPMAILLIFATGQSPSERYGPRYGAALYDSLMAYERTRGLIAIAARYGIHLAYRGSRTVGERYIQHCCPAYGANQGDYYVVEDRHRDTRFRQAISAEWCPACDEWDVLPTP